MYRHILVPTDGSKRSRRAARTAARLARAFRARLTAIHVTPEGVPTVFSGSTLYGAGVLGRDYRERAMRHAQRALSVVEDEARAAGAAYSSVRRVAREPWRAVISTARSRKCDLIVMASHGRSGLRALVLGSETMKVLAHTKTQVLVCR
ncbi:MAG TPA: universal stress protein [Burkholderiales bacterium]|nr:universal stress protein [Burkholderiales bacterium]